MLAWVEKRDEGGRRVYEADHHGDLYRIIEQRNSFDLIMDTSRYGFRRHDGLTHNQALSIAEEMAGKNEEAYLEQA
jgi:hypothetical protein